MFVGRKFINEIFIGSIKETEERLQFCKEKKLTSTIQIVNINAALERLEKNDVRF